MVFPFGVSISDFIEGIRLFKDAVEAFSDTKGARADYLELSRSLASLDKALKAASAVELDTDTRREAMKKAVENCQNCVTNFLLTVAKFDVLGNRKASTKKVVAGFRKIQWAICKKNDVLKFRSEIETHVGALEMLLLTFQIESLTRMNASLDSMNEIVVGIESQMRNCLMSQSIMSTKVRCAGGDGSEDVQMVEDEPASIIIASKERCNFSNIQQKLQSSLSTEDQQIISRCFQEIMEKNQRLKLQVQRLTCENQTLERQLLDIKDTVRIQNSMPPQVLLQQPVILHDSIGRIAPFHLEFINSVSALIAVLKIRFQYIGLKKIIRQEYGLREAHSQREIDIHKPWEIVFLVSCTFLANMIPKGKLSIQPGQRVEMSMLFPDKDVLPNHCPGCGLHDLRGFNEGEQVKCLNCPMIYRRTRRETYSSDIEGNYTSVMGDTDLPEDISRFCRVDLIEAEEVQYQNRQKEQGRGYWYCCACLGGPYGHWNASCACCDHPYGSCCRVE